VRRHPDIWVRVYRDAAMAYHRYFMYSAGFLDGDTMVTLFADFADLWDRAAADATPLRDIVGADPVEFGEEFVKAYSGRQWIDKERTRLTDAIAKAEREQS